MLANLSAEGIDRQKMLEWRQGYSPDRAKRNDRAIEVAAPSARLQWTDAKR
jgi:hypothetical protein